MCSSAVAQAEAKREWEGWWKQKWVSEHVNEWVREWGSVCALTARWGPGLHILCSVPLTFHMTWEDVEQSVGSLEVQYKYTHIHIRKIKSASGTHRCSKKNIRTHACPPYPTCTCLKKSINKLKLTSGHCLEYTPSKTIFHEQQTWWHSQLKTSHLTPALINTHALCWLTTYQVGNWHKILNRDGRVLWYNL